MGMGLLAHFYGPQPYLYNDNSWDAITPYSPLGANASQYNGILSQHSHTSYSDGKMTVRQNVEWHISMGYNIVFITDHNHLKAKADIEAIKAEYLEKGVIIVLGMEWTTNRFHMNILGIQEWNRPMITINPSNEEIQAVIQEAHRLNATVTVNHYLWSGEQMKYDQPTRAQFFEWGVDYFEVVNDEISYDIHYDAESVTFCNTNKIGQITGTDMHIPDGLSSKAVHGWTLLNITEFTEQGVMNALRDHNTTILYDSVGRHDNGQYAINPTYIFVQPLAELGNQCIAIFQNDQIVVGIFVYFGYAIGGFFLITGYYKLRARFWLKMQERKAKKESTK
jgi:hypothetical protein